VVRYQSVRLTDLRYVREHTLWLRFDDGLEGEVDLSDALEGELFEPLQDPRAFAEARVDYGAAVWPNGADWAPESLHDRLRATKGLAPESNGDDEPASTLHHVEMPEISRFFGIVIRMLAKDHAPPHFHASYGEYETTITIRDGLVAGRFPGRALRLVLEWHEMHRDELLDNWHRLRDGRPAMPIDPLV